MSSVNHQRLRELFESVMDLPAADRGPVLDAECGSDAVLRAEIESLLAHHDLSQAPLVDEQAGMGMNMAGGRDAGSPGPEAGALPESIGPYCIVRVLGVGGMGVVYLAEQEHPQRTVAVKVMRRSSFSGEMLSRFKREVRVLGQLQHPGIAHIYEAGTAQMDGHECAFFAMEWIKGEPLTKFAKTRSLDVAQRLDLVVQICDAVQHAHDRGVIHRDLKPANILVDDAGRTRVLDFGVARATHSDAHTLSVNTDVGQLVGTLQYMSPEQVGAQPEELDVRSDIYSLGVITFELLTGRPPYDVHNRTIAQAARTIQEVEPDRLSSINTRYRGDLETILGKALEKEKQRRYGSAAALAADIRRYLVHEPIAARPATTFYQLRKFAQRNKALVAGVIVAFVSLIAGFVASTIMFVRADDARQLAEAQRKVAMRESAKAMAVNAFLVQDMLAAPNPWSSGGRNATVAEVLDKASNEVAARFADEPEIEAAVRMTLGESYSALGLFQEAEPHLAKALAIREHLPEVNDKDLALSKRNQGVNRYRLGQFSDAEVMCRDALDRAKQAFGAESAEVAETLKSLGDIQTGAGDYAAAIASLEEAVRIHRGLSKPNRLAIAHCLSGISAAKHYAGDYEEAERLKLKVLSDYRRILNGDHPYVAQTLLDLGSSYIKMQRYGDAEKQYREALPMLVAHLGSEHAVVLSCHRSLATALSFLGKNDQAEPMLNETIHVSERTLGSDHPETIQALNCLATLLMRAGRNDEAVQHLADMVERAERALGQEHPETLKYVANLAWCYRNLGKPDKAERLFVRAVTGFEESLGTGHGDYLSALYGLCQALNAQKRWAEAAEKMQLMFKARRAAGIQDSLGSASDLNMLGTALVKAGDYAAARDPLTRCFELCREGFPPGDWRTAISQSNLGDLLSKLGEYQEGEAALLAGYAVVRTHEAIRPAMRENVRKCLIQHYERSGQRDKMAEMLGQDPAGED